jgi:hypothetical protein
MNTANLQLEGLMLAVAAINNALVREGVLDRHQIDDALRAAEATIDPEARASISSANRDAMRFPIRVLRLANANGTDAEARSFSALAKAVGEAHQLHW